MNVDELIKKINSEIEQSDKNLKDTDGLIRLREAAKNYSGKYKLIWSDELAEQIKNAPEAKPHLTGIEDIDNLVGGFIEEQLITLSGATKNGKTQMGMFLTSKYHELNPIFVGLEQSARELIVQYTRNGYVLPKFLTPENLATQVTIDWIEERIIEGIAKYNTKFVFVDHLGYIDDMAAGKYTRENHAYRIEKIMQGLKGIAKRWKIIILLNVHISQADEGNPPSLEDIKGSSAIAQESDKVLFVWRENTKQRGKPRLYTNNTLLTVAASRSNGKNGHVGLRFDNETGTYEPNMTWAESLEKEARSVTEF